MSGSEGRAGMRWRERERKRGGRRVVLKVVRYNAGGVGGVRDM